MRRACDNLRDRALVETAYESAFRPHELLSLKKSSVVDADTSAPDNRFPVGPSLSLAGFSPPLGSDQELVLFGTHFFIFA